MLSIFVLLNQPSEMAKVQVLSISILDNPTEFSRPFQFEVTFECAENLPHGEK